MSHRMKKINAFGEAKIIIDKDHEIIVNEFINATFLYWDIQERKEIEDNKLMDVNIKKP